MVVIHTKRLILREFDETDWQTVHSYASDPEVARAAWIWLSRAWVASDIRYG